MAKDLPNKKMKEIIRLYETKLKLPKKKIGKQLLICPVGLVGAGKTTIIKSLNRNLFLVMISADEIRKILKTKGYSYDRAKEITFIIAEKYLRQGFGIALDTNCASNESRKYIRKLKNEFKVKTIWLHVNPPEKFIINKLRNFHHTWLFKDRQQAVRNYYRTKSLYKNLSFPFLYTFDPSKPDLKSQIKEATNLIKSNS